MTTQSTNYDAFLWEVLDNVCTNVGALIDHDLVLVPGATEVVGERVAGRRKVHISFKLGFDYAGTRHHGCMLIPLPDALAIAYYLLMFPDAAVAEARRQKDLDREAKDALLELGNIIGGAFGEAIRSAGITEVNVRSEGCQGVRADVRPAFPYEEGTELLVGRAQTRIHDFPTFELILMIPKLPAFDSTVVPAEGPPEL